MKGWGTGRVGWPWMVEQRRAGVSGPGRSEKRSGWKESGAREWDINLELFWTDIKCTSCECRQRQDSEAEYGAQLLFMGNPSLSASWCGMSTSSLLKLLVDCRSTPRSCIELVRVPGRSTWPVRGVSGLVLSCIVFECQVS